MAQLEIPQISFPLRFAAGKPIVVEQDSDDEVRDCVEVLMRTPLGSRLEYSDYGIADPTFRSEVDLDEIREAIGEWELRADIQIDDSLDIEEMAREIRVGVATGEVADDG